MGKYQLKIKRSAEKELAVLPNEYIISISEEIFRLSENPFPPGFKKLKGFKNFYRIRVGKYRIIYTIDHGQLTIEVIKISHRKDAY